MSKLGRTLGLWILIVADVMLITVCFLLHNNVWGIFFSCITALVIGFELWGKFLSGKKKTISQMFWAWKEKEPFWAWVTVGLFMAAMAGLAIHLLS